MIRYQLLLFFIISLNASAQKVVVIDLASNNVSVKGNTVKVLKFNNRDKTYLEELLKKNIALKVAAYSKQCDTIYMFKSEGVENALDLATLKLLKCFINNDAFFPNYNKHNYNSFHNNYNGLVLNDSIKTALMKLLPADFSHLVVMNSYQIYNPNSIFALSADVLDNRLNKIAGFKRELKRSVSKTSAPELLNYYIQKSIDLFFESLINQVLK